MLHPSCPSSHLTAASPPPTPPRRQSFLPGPSGGRAFAEAIYGLLDPSGRLPLSWPTYSSSLFFPHWHAVSQQCDGTLYSAAPCGVGWPFGRGLSYAHVEYRELAISQPELRRGAEVTISVLVTNHGERALNHSVLLFAAASYRRVVPAAQELKDFQRVELPPSASVRVTFALPATALEYVGLEDAWLLEGGRYALWVDAELRPKSTDDCVAAALEPSPRCVFVDVRGDCQGTSCRAQPRDASMLAAAADGGAVAGAAGLVLLGWALGLGCALLLSQLRLRPGGRSQPKASTEVAAWAWLRSMPGRFSPRRRGESQEFVLDGATTRSHQWSRDRTHSWHELSTPTDTPPRCASCTALDETQPAG